MGVWVVVCLYMPALWLTGDLSTVYPAAPPMTAGIGSSTPATLLRISGIDNGWMDKFRGVSAETLQSTTTEMFLILKKVFL